MRKFLLLLVSVVFAASIALAQERAEAPLFCRGIFCGAGADWCQFNLGNPRLPCHQVREVFCHQQADEAEHPEYAGQNCFVNFHVCETARGVAERSRDSEGRPVYPERLDCRLYTYP